VPIAPHEATGDPVVAPTELIAKLPVPVIGDEVEAALQLSEPCALAEDASPLAAAPNASPSSAWLANLRAIVESQ
jgi:hypothetical protein